MFYVLYAGTVRCNHLHVHICLYFTIFVFHFFWLHFHVDFNLYSFISFSVVPNGHSCAFLAFQDTSRKIVTCPIMYLPCNRNIESDIFSISLLVHTFFSPILCTLILLVRILFCV